MKILHIIDNLSMGGGQNLLIGLAGIQKQRGNEVSILALESCDNKVVAQKIEEEGVLVEVISKTIGLYNPFQIFLLMPRIKKYDIIHVHLFPALYWVGFANLLTGMRADLVYTEHSTYNRRRTHLVLRRIDNFVYKHCYDRIIACADKALETYMQIFPGVKHVCAINNGVDIKKYWEAEPYT